MTKDDVELLEFIREKVLGDLCFQTYRSRGSCQIASPVFCSGKWLIGRSINLVERLLRETETENEE